MKTPLESRFVVGLSTVLALAAFACSGSPDTSIGTGAKNEKAPSSAKKDDTSSTADPTTPGASTTLSDTGACGQKATADACGDCCLAKTPTAYDASDEVDYTCICAATTCQTACADSVCAAADNQNEPTAACKTCLDTSGPACADKAQAVCDADAACKAVDACMTTSCAPLAAKENPGGGATPKVLKARVATRSIRQQ